METFVHMVVQQLSRIAARHCALATKQGAEAHGAHAWKRPLLR